MKHNFSVATETLVAILVATLLVVACGGGGGSSSGGGTATTSASITPFKGPFLQGATVNLRDATGNLVTLITGGTVNASGVANVTYNSNVTYPLTVEVTGPYWNEVSGVQDTTGAVPIRGLITDANAASAVPVTVVTETAVASLLGSPSTAPHAPISPASAAAALNLAGTQLGIPAAAIPAFDPVTHKANDANTINLAALAMVANNSQTGANLAARITSLAQTMATLNPASAPTDVIDQGAMAAAVFAMTNGASSVMATGVVAPPPPVIPAAPKGGSSAGSGSPGTSPTPTAQTLNVPLLLSDAASEDWSTIGVKLLSLTLTKSDNTSISVTLPASPTSLNLAQLDNLGEILSSVALTPGDTYTGATLTISANPGDVTLITSADPEAGFLAASGVQISPSQIQIQGASGVTGSMTVSVPVKFANPLVVPTLTSASTNAPAINIEVDLSHPTFIVGHVPAGGGTTLWSVNFNGPVRHKPTGDIRRLVLRHMYGTVASVSTDNTSLSFTKDMPTVPIVSPESGVATTQSMTVLADATNGTLFYDLDDKTKNANIKNFSSVNSILTAGKFVRVGARYQQNGTLVATRIWVGSTFNSVWISPEGHVLHANPSGSTIVVADELGKPVTLTVNANTQFFFRQPENALADVTPISSAGGLAFLQASNIVRGFKVHAQADTTTTPMTATTIDIETAVYQGKITSSASGVVFKKTFNTASDNYTSPLMSYISNTSANGNDPLTGAAITGFKYWNFAYPTIVDSGSNAINDFVSATGGSVSFGSAAYTYYAHGVAYAKWGDSANASGWSVPWVVVVPTDVPVGKVATVLTAPTAGVSTFKMSITGGTNPVTVDVSSSAGQATLVFLVSRSKDVITVTSLDVTKAGNLATLTSVMGVGTIVQISAAPQADGSLKAYVMTVYGGSQLPSN